MRLKRVHQHLSAIEDEALLDELGLTDEELDGIKGGPRPNTEGDGGGGPRPGSEDGGGGIGGDWVINHNETTVSDEEDETQLADLRPTDAASGTVKGGDGVCHGVSVLAWARVDGVSSSR